LSAMDGVCMLAFVCLRCQSIEGDASTKYQKPEKAPATAPLDDAYKNANPGDTATTKGILDDAVVQSFEDAGFGEDHRLSNLKLFLGALACAFALIAQVRAA
jgi:hypothetical protein